MLCLDRSFSQVRRNRPGGWQIKTTAGLAPRRRVRSENGEGARSKVAHPALRADLFQWGDGRQDARAALARRAVLRASTTCLPRRGQAGRSAAPAHSPLHLAATQLPSAPAMATCALSLDLRESGLAFVFLVPQGPLFRLLALPPLDSRTAETPAAGHSESRQAFLFEQPVDRRRMDPQVLGQLFDRQYAVLSHRDLNAPESSRSLRPNADLARPPFTSGCAGAKRESRSGPLPSAQPPCLAERTRFLSRPAHRRAS